MPAKCRFFAVRPASETTGTSGEAVQSPELIVPLIPLDELPSWIDIKDVPRYLGIRNTAMMTNVGDLPSLPNKLEILMATGAPDALGSKSPFSDLSSPAPTESDSGASAQSLKHNGEGQSLPPPKTARSDSSGPAEHTTASKTEPLPTPPVDDQQRSPTKSKDDETDGPKYCQKYCHHGPSGPKGCLRGTNCHSIHELPRGREGLRSVGLGRIPYWHPESTQFPPELRPPREEEVYRSKNGQQSAYRKQSSDKWSAIREHRTYETRTPSKNFREHPRDHRQGYKHISKRKGSIGHDRHSQADGQPCGTTAGTKGIADLVPLPSTPTSFDESVYGRASTLAPKDQALGLKPSKAIDRDASEGLDVPLIDMS